jgi:hypothetical protein
MSAHDFVLVAPLFRKIEKSLERRIMIRVLTAENVAQSASADTFREGSTGTCECTRLSLTSATEYFL